MGPVFCNIFPLMGKVLANVISPMTFVFGSRLIFGNFIIGVIEGLIVAWIMKCRRRRAIWIMILANYVSLLAGMVLVWLIAIGFVCFVIEARFNPLSSGLFIIVVMPVVAFVVTVLLEWPFCRWTNSANDTRWRKSLKACLIAQVASYSLIFPFYLLTSQFNLYLQTDTAPVASFLKNPDAVIYYLDDDRCLSKIKIDGSSKEKLLEGEKLEYWQIFIWPGVGEKSMGLWGGRFHVYDKEDRKILISGMEVGQLPIWYRTEWYGLGIAKERNEYLKHPMFPFPKEIIDKQKETYEDGSPYRLLNDEITDYRNPKDEQDWAVAVSSFKFFGEGIRALHRDGGFLDTSLQTPFVRFGCSHVTVLPHDQVVCDMGEYIVLIDLNERKIGVITSGRSPVVVFESNGQGLYR